MTRSTPLRAQRLNLPGRTETQTDGDDTDRSAALDDDLAALRPALDGRRVPSDPTPSATYVEATSLSPPWLKDRRDHEAVDVDAPVAPPAPAPRGAPPLPAPADRPAVGDGDEWEALRTSGDAAEARGSDEKKPGGRQTLTRTLLELPVLIIIAAVIAFLVRTFVAQAFYIPSESMTPQLQVNDRIVVSKLAYRLHEPRRGDIVVFDNPRPAPTSDEPERALPVRVLRTLGEAVGVVQPSTEEFIKRVIALPGETVEGRDNHILIDGRILVEPYIEPADRTYDFAPVTVPPGHLWVMGDNRDGSSDSRSFGPIRQSSIVGRTVVRVWPLGDASFL